MLTRPLALSRPIVQQQCPSSLPARCFASSASRPRYRPQLRPCAEHQAAAPQRVVACSSASSQPRAVLGSIVTNLRRPAHAPSRPGPPHCASTNPAATTTATHTHQQQEQGASNGGQQQQQQQQQQLTWMTCKRCKERFAAEQNHRTACRYHSENWTGGELAKAVGFVRQSEAPEHQLGAVMGRTGLLRFWDCCGAEEEGAPGCCTHYHVSFDEEVNERYHWVQSD